MTKKCHRVTVLLLLTFSVGCTSLHDNMRYGELSALDTKTAYQTYLTEYPTGIHASEAQKRMDYIILAEKTKQEVAAHQKAESSALAKRFAEYWPTLSQGQTVDEVRRIVQNIDPSYVDPIDFLAQFLNKEGYDPGVGRVTFVVNDPDAVRQLVASGLYPNMGNQEINVTAELKFDKNGRLIEWKPQSVKPR